MNSKRKKVAIYIDGSNMYFSIKKTFKCKIDLDKEGKVLGIEILDASEHLPSSSLKSLVAAN